MLRKHPSSVITSLQELVQPLIWCFGMLNYANEQANALARGAVKQFYRKEVITSSLSPALLDLLGLRRLH